MQAQAPPPPPPPSSSSVQATDEAKEEQPDDADGEEAEQVKVGPLSPWCWSVGQGSPRPSTKSISPASSVKMASSSWVCLCSSTCWPLSLCLVASCWPVENSKSKSVDLSLANNCKSVDGDVWIVSSSSRPIMVVSIAVAIGVSVAAMLVKEVAWARKDDVSAAMLVFKGEPPQLCMLVTAKETLAVALVTSMLAPTHV
jgi:hypothetical protein